MTSRAQQTRITLRHHALDLFMARGYDRVTVADIAEAAGVSHMTFFRHFPTKESVVVGDLFDPLIAEAVARQSADEPPFARAVLGLVAAMTHEAAQEEMRSEAFRRRLALVATTPALAHAVRASGRATEEAVARALADGTEIGPDTAAAAGALLGAATSVLLAWTTATSPPSADEVLSAALLGLIGRS